MIIVEHKKTGDIEHIIEYQEMDNYIRTKLEPGSYFTIKARNNVESDLTYQVPS